MLRFIIGRKGTGKTKRLHEELSKSVSGGKEVILLVPKQFTFESDRRILDEMGPKSAASVEVLSFSRLAGAVLTSCRGVKKPLLKEGANAVLMSFALEGVRDRLKFFARHSGSISFIKKMTDEISALKKDAVSAGELEAAAAEMPDGMLKQKMLETALIYSAYDAETAQSFFDDRELLTLVAEILGEFDFFGGKTVAIDNFSRFSGQEMKIIERILQGAENVIVTACTDDIFSLDAASPFAAVNRSVRKIISAAKKLSAEIEIERVPGDGGFSAYLAPELAHFERNIYEPDFDVFDGKANAVTVCSAPNAREECDFAARQIKRLLRTGFCRCRDIAVVFRNEEPYEKEIRHSLKKFGVPIFEDKRQPIENEPLIILLRSALAVCADGFSTDSLMRLCKTGLFGLSAEQIASAENYAVMWSLGSAEWQREWTDNPDGFGVEMNEQRLGALRELNEIRRKMTEPLLVLREKLKDRSGRSCVAALYEFLIENGVDLSLKEYAISLENAGNIELALEQQQVWDILMDVLDQIAQAFGDRYVTAKRLLEIFDLVISTQSLGKLPDGFDEVHICSSDRIQTKTARVVFVLGMNSGLFPPASTESGLFGEFEKEKIRELLPDFSCSAAEQTAYERFMVYSSLCAARERLYVSFSLSGDGGERLAESPAVTMLKKILPGLTEVSAAELPVHELVESESAAFELTAKLWNENTPEAAALKQYFYGREDYRGKMLAIERAVNKKRFTFSDKNTAKQLFGENMRLSASRLEDFEKCPFMYFCKHGLMAKPRKTARLDPAASGTLVHFALERLLSNHRGERLSDIGEEKLGEEAAMILEQYVDSFMGGRQDKSKRFNYLFSRTLKILKAIISRLVCEFSESGFEPCDFELEIGGEKVKSFKIPLDEGTIEIRGFIDRVDKMEIDGKAYIRIVDYKTGTRTFSLSDVLSGLGMQMMIYLVSIWRNGENYYGDKIVPAGVLYFPARFEPYSVDRGDDAEKRKMKKLSGGKMDGMLLSDENVLGGMDRGLSALFMPVTKDKRTGALKGNFISLEQLGKLAHKMDGIMAEMGNELHRGNVPARPALGKNHGDTCEWCDYQNVCMRDEGGEYRRIEALSHGECLEILDGGDKDEADLD